MFHDLPLRADRQFPENAPLPMLMERLMVQGDAFTMIGEGRGYAGNWFQSVATDMPELADLLNKAAGQCHRISGDAWGMAEILGGPGMGEEQARKLAVRENRLAIADIVHRCRDLDRELADVLAELALTCGAL